MVTAFRYDIGPKVNVIVDGKSVNIINTYSQYLRASKGAGTKGGAVDGSKSQMLQTILEKAFASLYGAVRQEAPSGQVGTPDLKIEEKDFLEAYLKLNRSDQIELKLKQGGKGSTTIGSETPFSSGPDSLLEYTTATGQKITTRRSQIAETISTSFNAAFRGLISETEELYNYNATEQRRLAKQNKETYDKKKEVSANAAKRGGLLELYLEDYAYFKQPGAKPFGELVGARRDRFIANLVQKDKLFEILLSDPSLRARVFAKARILQITSLVGNTVRVHNIVFSEDEFKKPPFDAKITDNGKIKVFLQSNFEKQLLSQLSAVATIDVAENVQKETKNALNAILAGTKLQEIKIPNYNGIVEFRVPTGGSIPMATITLTRQQLKKKSSAPQESAARTLIQTQNLSVGKFISSIKLGELVKQRMLKVMPHGPVGGRALSNRVLTNRTGRFVDSLKLRIDYLRQIVMYNYDPRYYIHEQDFNGANRDPRRLIRESVQDVVRNLFKRQFSVRKG